MRGATGLRPRWDAARAALAVGAIGVAATTACGVADGDRFGRVGARPGAVRIHLLAPVVELDPARARDDIDRAVALQAFAPLLEPDGRPRLAHGVSTSADGSRVVITLDARARFSDATPIDADVVVWSWRRALLRSTGAVDLRPLASIARGRALAEGRLLRLARDAVGHAAPFTTVGVAPTTEQAIDLRGGTLVSVVDSNERKPCCGRSVPLLREPGRGEALGALNAGDVGTIIGVRTVEGRRHLQLRSSSGAAGWTAEDLVAVHVPPASLLRVVDRGDGAAALRVGPDEDAPVRHGLRDDDVVEVLGIDEGWVNAVDLTSGHMGFLPRRSLEALRGVQQWLGVVAVDAAATTVPAWVPLRDLAFDPSALGAHAVDSTTIEIECEADAAAVLAALAQPVLAPVPPHTIAQHGRAWTTPAAVVTSGPFTPVVVSPERVVLARSEGALERDRAKLERVELLVIEDPVAALHLYRAGELDVVLAVPADLAPRLKRASDWVPEGGLVAPEVRGLSLARLDLRGVQVAYP